MTHDHKAVGIGLSAVVGALFGCVMWLSLVPTSALNRLLANTEALGLGWVCVNYPGFLIGGALAGGFHSPPEWAVALGTSVEWFAVTFCLFRLTRRAAHSGGQLTNGNA
jgi:hypothetical protein